MGQILIGLVLIAGGAAFGLYMFKKHGASAMEMSYMQTSSIADAVDMVNSMKDSDPNFRHYVEIKGNLQSEEQVIAPFTERNVAYYENSCYSVSEETRTERDSDGNRRTRTVKKENKISDETSPVPVFIRDESCDIPVYADVKSFGGDLELQDGCDRFEREGSGWMTRNSGYFRQQRYGSDSRFLGYRLKEEVLNDGQPIYALGELYSSGGKYYIGKSVIGKKPSKFSYKSEDQLVSDTKGKKYMSAAIGALAAVGGIVLILTSIF